MEINHLKPDFPEAHANRGKVKIALGDIEGAKTDFQVALELAERQDKEGVKADLQTAMQLAEQQDKEDFKVYVEQLIQN